MTSTLLDAVRSSSATPYLRVLVGDRDAGVPRLRPVRWYEGAEDDGPTGAACPADGSLVRARVDDGGTLFVQRVATPSELSDFGTWSSLTTAEPGVGIGCAAAGTRVLLAYYDGTAVRLRESTDSGATFGSASTLVFLADVTAVACAVREDGTGAVTWARSSGVVSSSLRAGTGSWGSPAAWPHSLAVSGLAMMSSADWGVVVSGEDGDGAAGVWTAPLGSGVLLAAGTWGPLTNVILASPDTDVTYRATAAMQATGPRLFLVESYGGAGAFDRAMLASAMLAETFEDGAWRDPLPLAHESPYGLAAAAASGARYLCSSDGVWFADPAISQVDIAPAVIEARYDAALGRPGREQLALTLAPDEVPESALLAPGIEVEFRPGYVTDAGLESVAARTFQVTAVRRTLAAIEVHAEGLEDRLERWRAPREFTWAAGERSILSIAGDLCKYAGMRVLTADASAACAALLPAFRVRAGEPARTALERLFTRTGDAMIARGMELRVTLPDADATAVAEFGGAAPNALPCLAVTLGEDREEAGWARVFGDGIVAQAVDIDAIARGGGVAIAVDEGVSTAVEAADRATAVLRASALGVDRGVLEAHAHPGLEPGDVIEVTDPSLGLDAARFRVATLRLELRRRGYTTYRTRIGLTEA